MNTPNTMKGHVEAFIEAERAFLTAEKNLIAFLKEQKLVRLEKQSTSGDGLALTVSNYYISYRLPFTYEGKEVEVTEAFYRDTGEENTKTIAADIMEKEE